MVAKEMLEVWLEIPDYPGYKVSNLGRVKSTRIYKEGRMIGSIVDGYYRVGLWIKGSKGKYKYYATHILVCTLFNGPKPSPDHQVCHNDGNKLNNKASNLRWGTNAENKKDSIRLGEMPRGINHISAKLTEDQVREIRKLGEKGLTVKAIGSKFNNVTKPAIRAIIKRQIWAWLD